MRRPEFARPPSDHAGLNADATAPLILTPHNREFMRLLGTEDSDAIKDRVSAVRDFSQKHGVVLVLKGERPLIAEPGGCVVVSPTGNTGLGKAGNGDTLAGIIAGFCSQAAALQIEFSSRSWQPFISPASRAISPKKNSASA